MVNIVALVFNKRYSGRDPESRRQGVDSRFRGNDAKTLMEVIPDLIQNPVSEHMEFRFAQNECPSPNVAITR